MHYSLIQRRYRCHCGTGRFLSHKYYPQPFFLLQLAGKLRAEGHTVKLFDLFRNKPTGKEREGADVVVVGTGEYAADSQYPTTWNEPPGTLYAGAAAWLNAPKGIRVVDPLSVKGADPAWDLIDFNNYPKPEGRLRAVLRLTQGCPNHCAFCPVPVVYPRYLGIDLEWSLRQLDYLYNQRGVREFDLVDDNLLANKKRAMELLEVIPSRFPEAHFFQQEGMEVRQATDLELCKALKKAGFYSPRIGVETLSDAVRRGTGKPQFTSEEALLAAKNLKEAGFKDYIVFLIRGLPGNTPEQEDRDVRVFTELGLRVRNHTLITYPGKEPEAPSVLGLFT